MQDRHPVIQLAKERALFKFSALAHRMVQDADVSLGRADAAIRSDDHKAIASARQFLRTEGNVFLKRLQTSYCDYVERAMQTMYRDLRENLRDISADTLTLIDDATVTRQIEVGRLALRMCDADQQSLGRINIMIAQLHDDYHVRERENPFRPYLMARALHDVLRDMVRSEQVAKILFDHLSDALGNLLPEYFAAIRGVFESSGVHARLLARPATLTRRQREQLAPLLASGIGDVTRIGGLPDDINPHTLHDLRQVLTLLQPVAPGAAGFAATTGSARDDRAALQDFVRKIVNQSEPGRFPSDPRDPDGGAAERCDSANRALHGPKAQESAGLVLQMDQYQQTAPHGQAVNGNAAAGSSQLFGLQKKIEPEKAGELKRVTSDVVAMLFDFILAEECISPKLRAQIDLLRAPFLKASLLAPELLQQPDHPARHLLNRIGSVAAGLDTNTPAGHRIASEITRIANGIRADFKDGPAAFRDALAQLDHFLATYLPQAYPDLANAIDAIDAMEKGGGKSDIRLTRTTAAVRDLLSPLKADQRAVDFILKIWVRVVIREAEQDAAGRQYCEVLPDLVWSVQEKQSPAERSALIRLLPSLAGRLKDGLTLIGMSDEQSRQALDQLVAVHTQLLRAAQVDSARQLPTLDMLRKHFSRLVVDRADTSAAPAAIRPRELEAALAARGISARLHLEDNAGMPPASDAEWLDRMQPGTYVECWSDGVFRLGRLIWINARRSLYVFKLDDHPGPLVFSSTALIKALREGSLGLMEYAPIFDRAIESLLQNTEDARQAAG